MTCTGMACSKGDGLPIFKPGIQRGSKLVLSREGDILGTQQVTDFEGVGGDLV